MPLALIAAGTVLLLAAMRGTQDDLFALVKKDFTGQGNFFVWILAIVLIGSVGYVKEMRPLSNAFLVLVLIIMLLSANKGGKDFFSSLLTQIRGTETTLGDGTFDPFASLGKLFQ